MPETIRNIRPYYSISCTIKHEDGDLDLSQNLMSVTIVSSINAPYQTVITSFLVDSKILVRKDLFGKSDILLDIALMTEGVSPSENIKLELITIRQDVPLSMKEQSELGIQVEDMLTLVNIIKQPYIQMSTPVNKLFDESHRKTPIEMVEDIISDFLPANINTDIRSTNINTEKLFQFIVPPMSFMNSIRYIDGSDMDLVNKFGPGVGIFNGPMFFTNRFEIDGGNTFCIWDLGSMMGGEIEYMIYQLALGDDDSTIMEKAGVEDDVFYTRNTVSHIYRGNQDIIANNYTNKYISKPSNDLYELVEVSMEEAFENSVKDGGTLDINEILKSNYSYRFLEVGLETTNIPYMARLSRKISSLSEIEIYVDRNLSINKLSRVGVPIDFIPRTADYVDLGGRYIVNSSRINFSRETDSWVARTRIRAARANVKK